MLLLQAEDRAVSEGQMERSLAVKRRVQEHATCGGICEEWRRVKEAVLVVKESARAVVKRKREGKRERFRTGVTCLNEAVSLPGVINRYSTLKFGCFVGGAE